MVHNQHVPILVCYGPQNFLSCFYHQVPPASAKQPGVNLSTAATPFQQAGGYGQHSYATGEGRSPKGEVRAAEAGMLTCASCTCHARL